jgi:hypothetical protein
MLSPPGEFKIQKLWNLIVSMMTDYGQKQLVVMKAKQGFSRYHEINCLTNFVEQTQYILSIPKLF